MADTVTSQTIADGDRIAILKFTNVSDGSGESAVKKVDVSALTTNSAGETCTSVSIARIYWATRGMGVDIEWGQDLDYSKEKVLTQDFDVPHFLTHYPKIAKPFYHRVDPDDGNYVLCHDLLAPEGYGEIIGGAVFMRNIWMTRIENPRSQVTPTCGIGWTLRRNLACNPMR